MILDISDSKENEDLSLKAKARFSISLRSLSQPMSLGEIARTWDICARTVISEHAQQSGGGSFSSKYGTWEDCLTSAWSYWPLPLYANLFLFRFALDLAMLTSIIGWAVFGCKWKPKYGIKYHGIKFVPFWWNYLNASLCI